ncbi:MAG: PstS family phosphate ABC transporter substrate-binding protein [Holophaga sp.]|nr:PstS family phosphate ABC transporter substrate-binding protein [Holophaga sp.]
MRWMPPALLLCLLTACNWPKPVPDKPQGTPPVAQAAQETPLMTPARPAPLEEKLPEFVPDPAVPKTGAITSIGSDSMDPLMQLWLDDFHAAHPGVTYNLVSKGSATAPKAMVAGTTLMGQMSREMNAGELAAFQAKFGYPPTRVVVAMDALAVYVNANNPIAKLGLEQVDAIFSKGRKGGYGRPLDTWGDLGLTLEWATRPIQPYGRDENSGTRAFFREHVLKNGDYKDIVKSVPDQFALVEAAAMDASAIAYGPVQHSLRMVKAVPIVDFNGVSPIVPTVENILNGKYPLARFLYIYVNIRPGQPADPLIKEFFRFVLSRQGQSDVANFGAIPLPADLAGINLNKVR